MGDVAWSAGALLRLKIARTPPIISFIIERGPGDTIRRSIMKLRAALKLPRTPGGRQEGGPPWRREEEEGLGGHLALCL